MRGPGSTASSIIPAMEFEWDEAKNEANRLKHGFDFTTASRTDIRMFSVP
jgi:uncharacterized DUF497 family protein